MYKRTMIAAFVAIAGWAVAEVPYTVGIAGYTFHKKSIDETLAVMKKIGCADLCVKDFHLKLSATDAEIAAFKKKLAAAGVTARGCGPIYMKSEAEARAAFAFAKRYGLDVVVGVPYEMNAKGVRVESDKMLDIVDALVKEYDIAYAIHNHGPDIPYLFPTAEAAMKRIGNRDKRIGVCLDVGHERRAGLDPVKFIQSHGDRIYDVHIKDIQIDAKRNLARVVGRGELDIPAILKALAEVGYTRSIHLEYETNFNNNETDVATSIGYLQGVADTIQVAAKMQPVPDGANTLSAAEKADGWKLLWDGKTSAGWVGVKGGCKSFPAKGWTMKDGALTMMPVKGISSDGRWFPLPPEDQKLGGGGDIVTVKKYKDFTFKFDFRMTKAANSGVKYFFDEKQNRGTCEEYQILDDGHPDSSKGKNGNRRVASLYDILPANAEKIVKPLGQWNTGMIVSKGNHVEHWLNGVKVLEYERGSKSFRDGVNASKYATWGDGKPWGEIPEGRILLQDHSDSTVSFCNLKIKE